MKKIVALLMVLVMSLSLCACGFIEGEEVETLSSEEIAMSVASSKTAEAFRKSKQAYDNIDVAYDFTEQFSADLYEAWRLGIYDSENILRDGCSYLATELYLTTEELEMGTAWAWALYNGYDWDKVEDGARQYLIDESVYLFSIYKDDLFSFCVESVIGAYTVNGKIDEAQLALDEAKMLMKELSADYSDYEHYPNLKGYYTTTKSFFEFCCVPEGSFEQVKDTINDYRNEARDYISDLDYIFEE